MWRETYCAKHLLHYLRNHTYRGLPPALFDRYLWLYADVEEFQHQVVYGASQKPNLCLYEAIEGNHVSAIATVLAEDQALNIQFDALQASAMEQFFTDVLSQHKGMDVTLTVNNLESANQAARLLNAMSVPRKVKYYTCREAPLSELPVIEVQPGEDHPAALDYFWRFMHLGQRSFGLFLENRFRTMASLVQLTCLQAQIISVETFDPSDYHKGFAKAVCALALQQGLKDAKVVTWSTSPENVASCHTAEALEMKPYYTLFEIQGKINL